MSKFEYFKSLQFSAMEVAVLDSALAAYAEKLASMLGESSLPAISIRNMYIEWDATQQALAKLSASRFEAVSALTVKDGGAAVSRYKEFCRLRDYRKPGVEVCRYTEAEAFALATHKLMEESVANLLPAEQTEWSTQ